MKKHFLFTAFMAFAFVCMGLAQVNAQSLSQNSLSSSASCGAVVASGCVGACGSTASISYTVPVSAEYKTKVCLQTDQSSLCPNTGARAKVYKNGSLVATVNITAVGSGLGILATSGDVITVEVSLFPIKNNIQCVWLGNLDFSLRN